MRTSRPLYGHLVTLARERHLARRSPVGLARSAGAELAQRLRISRTTVVSAYRELESRGLLRGYVGRGTFVCAAPDPTGAPFAWRGKIAAAALRTERLDPARHDPPLVERASCCRSPPASRRSIAFPSTAFQHAIDHVLKREARAVWRHGPTEGQPALREAIAERFGVPAESVLILARRAAGPRSARALPRSIPATP